MEDQVTQLVLPNQQFWVLFIGSLVPLLAYYINKVAPWESEQFKAAVHVILTALAGAGYAVIFGDIEGVGDFMQESFTAVVAGLFAHNMLWKPAGLNLKFGAAPPTAEVY